MTLTDDGESPHVVTLPPLGLAAVVAGFTFGMVQGHPTVWLTRRNNWGLAEDLEINGLLVGPIQTRTRAISALEHDIQRHGAAAIGWLLTDEPAMSAGIKLRELYALIAQWWGSGAAALARRGNIRFYRFDCGSPVARIPGEPDAATSVLEVVTQRREHGRELLLDISPSVGAGWGSLISLNRVSELITGPATQPPDWLRAYWTDAAAEDRVSFTLNLLAEVIAVREVHTEITRLASLNLTFGDDAGMSQLASWLDETSARLASIVTNAQRTRPVQLGVGNLVTDASTRLNLLTEIHAVLTDDSLGSTPTVRLWQRAFHAVLPRLLDVPFHQKPELEKELLRTLLDKLPAPLHQRDRGHRPVLDPHWLLAAFSTDTAPTGPDWARGKPWSKLAWRSQLAIALIAAITGNPRWIAELPGRRRSDYQLIELAPLWTVNSLRGFLDRHLDLLESLPGPGALPSRAPYLSAWIALGQTLARTVPLFEEVAHQRLAGPDIDTVTELLERLRHQLAARAPPDRAEAILRAVATLESAARDSIGPLYDAHLDTGSPLRFDAGSEEFNALVRYLPASTPLYRALFAHWLRAYQPGGGDRAAGNAAWDAAWRAWVTSTLGPGAYIARDEAPADLDWVVTDEDGNAIRVLIGVSHDPIERMHLGHPRLGGSCLCLVHGAYRQFTQAYLVNPRIAVLFAWEHRDGERGRRLAQLSVFVTDQGILPLYWVFTDSRQDFDPAFSAYLKAWGDNTGRPLIALGSHDRNGEPINSALLPHPASLLRDFTVEFPTAGRPADDFWDYISTSHIELPESFTTTFWRYLPPRTRRGPG